MDLRNAQDEVEFVGEARSLVGVAELSLGTVYIKDDVILAGLIFELIREEVEVGLSLIGADADSRWNKSAS